MQNRNQLKTTSKNPFSLLLIFAAVTTLFFNSKLQDPFNSPKQWLLFLTTSWLLGYLLVNRKSSEIGGKLKSLKYLLIALVASLFVSTIFTDVTYTAFIGETQRRLGFLTYFGFAVVMFSSAYFIQVSILHRLYITNFILGLILGSYGLLQYAGKDFVPWSNPYNRIIGTLGNPNFASSMMAIVACLCVSTLFIKSYGIFFRFANLVLATVLLFAINSSESIQGLVAFCFGTSAVFLILLIRRSKTLGALGGLVILIIGISAVLGMLQVGPLSNFLYKGSVTVRGFYWRAGFEMFKDYPWTGVGIDRFGAYFKQYKEQQYVLSYGYDISSSSAHNTFIQMFATAGFIVGITFLLLHLYILLCGVRLLANADKNHKVYFSGLFGAWLVYASQMVISIDNIGLTIWGWILGGVIVGLFVKSKSNDHEVHQKNYTPSKKSNDFQPVVSGVMIVATVVLIAILFRGESITMQARNAYNPNDPSNSPKLSQIANQAFQTPLIDPFYKLKIAELLAMSGARVEALEVMNQLSAEDPRNQDFLMSRAALMENLGDYASAILIRKELAKYDPLNSKNYLELGRNYKLLGNFVEMKKYRDIVIKIDGLGAESKIAKEQLVN
jgi:O-antigen ligase